MEKQVKVGGITRANNWMVIQTFIAPSGATVSYVLEGQSKEVAESWLKLTRNTEGLAEYNEQQGGLLSSVVVFEKTRDGYIQRGRVDL